MKKILIFLLIGIFLLQPGILLAHAAEKQAQEPKWVSLSMINNIDYGDITLEGAWCNGIFYVTADKLAKYAHAQLLEDTEEQIRMMVFNRPVTITSDGSILDEISNDSTVREFAVPVLVLRGKLYVSMLHFYRYIGVNISFADSADAPVHVFIDCPYTLYEAMGEYVENMEEYTFTLEEVLKKGMISNIIKKTAALDTMLIEYDSSLTNHMFNVSTAAEDIMSQCLAMCVQEEGDGYTDKLMSETIQFTKEVTVETDVTGSILTLAEKAAAASGKAAQTLTEVSGKVFTGINVVSQAATVYFEAANAYRMYDAIPEAQGGILENTFVRMAKQKDSALYQGNPILFDVSGKVQQRIKDNQANMKEAVAEAANKGVLAAINMAKQGKMTKALGWPYAAVNAIYSITVTCAKTDPVIGEYVNDEIQLTQARACMDIQNAALQLFVDDFGRFMDNKMYYTDENCSMETLLQIKSDILLILKSALAARRLVLDTGFANEEEKAELERLMQECTALVSSVEYAQLILPGYVHAATDDDLTWMESLTVRNNGGLYVEQNGLTYYWKISPGFYSEDVALLAQYESYINPNVSNTLVCRDEEGKETGILLGYGHTGLYLYDGKLYWHWDNRCDGGEGMVVHAYDLTTGENQRIGEGIMVGLDELSGIAVIQNDYHIYMYDIHNKELKLADSGGNVLQMAGEYIYFEDEGSESGTMELYRMSVLKRKAELMDTLKAEPTGRSEFTGQFNYVCVNSYVHDGYLYLCNGIYAGTGGVFQGGQIGRIKLDGSGKYELLDGDSSAYTEDDFLVYDRDDTTYIVYTLYGEATNWEYTAVQMNVDSKQAAMAGSDISARRGTNSAYAVYQMETGFMWNDPEKGVHIPLLTREEVQTLGFDPYLEPGGQRNYTQMGFAAQVGDKLYFSLVENDYVEEDSIGWRSAFKLDHRAAFVKDMQTGQITKLYDF